MSFLDVSRVGMPISTKRRHELRYNCVFCEDTGYHLYVNTQKKLWHCFKCNAAGRTNITEVSMNQIYLNTTDQLETEEETEFIPLRLPPIHKDTLTRTAIRYLEARGVYESDCQRHKIYAASPKDPRWFGRIIIPCNARSGYADYYVGRAYTRLHFPKYINPNTNKRQGFFSPDVPDSKREQMWGPSELLIVEGPFDFIKASRHGPCLALLGKELSDVIARRIVSDYDTAYILLDQGLPEKKAALKIKGKLDPFIETIVLDCPKKDPGEMSPRDFREMFESMGNEADRG